MNQQQYILNRLPIGIVMLDQEHRVTSYSGTAAALFGESVLGASLGKPIEASHPERSRSKIAWLIQQSQMEGASGFASMLVNAPDKVLQLRVVALADLRGPTGYCLVVYDITELATQTEEPRADGEFLATPRRLSKLPVSQQGRIALLDIEEVAFMRAQGHYSDVCAGGKHYFCGLSVAQLEARLPKEHFVKVHRSYLVNLAFATAVDRRDDQLILAIAGACAHEIPVSRGNVTRVRELLGV